MIANPKCPICGKELAPSPTARSYEPFCSERCRKVDLFRWFDGKYAIVEPLYRPEPEEEPGEDIEEG
ncbi:MAG: DNA gyrase inhibitor YacG [Planctomycetaceae bacterium]|nr:DNA gyrase inhibitor YacG [Planctomycetaceae bacterium]